MEQNVNVWKANLTNGLILGIAGIMFTLIVYFLDLTFNKSVGYIFMVIGIVLLYFFLKSYRDNFLHGSMTYGQSVGAGVIIYLYYSVISAIFIYLLYKVIDTGLTNKMLAYVEEEMMKSGKVSDSDLETVMAMQRKILRPEFMAPLSLITNMFYGTVISLIVSIFVKREKNPLIDAPEN